jgi:hypothetical protein
MAMKIVLRHPWVILPLGAMSVVGIVVGLALL